MSTIAIIGAGSVGRALGAALVRCGHHVVFGMRDPAAGDDLPGTRRAIGAAAGDAEVVILAVPADAVVDVVPRLGLRPGHVVIDATNAVRGDVPSGHPTMGDVVASLVPEGVEVAKGFNTVGAEHLDGHRVDGRSVFLPVAGDDRAVDVVLALAGELGFDAVSVGGREAFGLVEAHARLWIQLAFGRGWGRGFAFSVVRG